jgi:hypothetical protein
LVRYAAGEKGPHAKRWPDLAVKPEDIPAGSNIGLIMGHRSGGLCDVDLDCREALALADIYLPATGACFGRKSKPLSHWLYIASGARFAKFADPISGDMLVELRCDGSGGEGAHQTMAPPSLHPSGERVEWHGDVIAPAVVDHRILHNRVRWLAIGSLVMRYVSEYAARQPGLDLPRLLWEWDHDLGRPAYGWLGVRAPDEPRRHPRQGLEDYELDLAEIVHAIPNNCSWEEWNNIGLAIYAASGGTGAGLIVFDDLARNRQSMTRMK